MNTLFLWAAALLAWPALVSAQDDTAHHRAVYQEINAREKTYRQVVATVEDSPLIFSLTGYLDGKEVRKIVAVSSEDGGGYEEFYLENGKPLFVFSTYSQDHLSAHPRKVEDRRYFRNGRIFKWLTTDKSPPDQKTDMAESTKRLNGLCREFVAALSAQAGSALKAEGVFKGIDQGDYAHWKMRTAEGEDRTFFILRPDASVEKVLENPAPYVGRRCRITWKKTTENLPDAGGRTEVEQIVGVEWPKK